MALDIVQSPKWWLVVGVTGIEPARAGRPTSFQSWPVYRFRHTPARWPGPNGYSCGTGLAGASRVHDATVKSGGGDA